MKRKLTARAIVRPGKNAKRRGKSRRPSPLRGKVQLKVCNSGSTFFHPLLSLCNNFISALLAVFSLFFDKKNRGRGRMLSHK